MQNNIEKYFKFFSGVANTADTNIVPENDIIQVNNYLKKITIIENFNIQEKTFLELKENKKKVINNFVSKIR